ncbi:MAG: hypothetical protein ACE5DX_00745 [Candidatus Dojkabacteria bacterium]
MRATLQDFKLSKSVFLHKVINDLEFGVRVRTGSGDNKDVIRVWTDTKEWQFSMFGLVGDDHIIEVERAEIQSFGESLKYIKLILKHSELDTKIELQKLSPNFAELSEVSAPEAQGFIEGYMASTVNRTLTAKLFKEYARSEHQLNWLEY